MVDSKQTAKPVNVAPLAKMRNQLLRRHSGMIGLIFSDSGFTTPAIILAQYMAPQSILLWNGKEVEHILNQKKIKDFLEYKYRSSVETGIPDASIQDAFASSPLTSE
jgi:hypothetical protein